MYGYTVTLLLAVLVPHAAAQEELPTNAVSAVVEPFDALVGRWKAEGTYAPDPDQPAKRWTATAEARWILGGHFVQEDVEVDLGAATPLLTRTVFGWDDARDRFVALSIDNNGRSEFVEVFWSSATTLVAFTTETAAGGPVFSRSVWEFGDRRYTHRVDRATGDGAWRRIVEGEFVRVDELPARAAETAFGGGAVGAEMAQLAPLAGSYSLEGEQIGSGGRTIVSFRGRDTLRAMYGGHVLAAEMTVTAPGGRRASNRYLAWDPVAEHYDVFSIDDRGGVGATQLRWDGEDSLVGETLDTDGDEKILASSLVEVGSDGLRRVVSSAVRATGENLGRVELRYRKTEEKK